MEELEHQLAWLSTPKISPLKLSALLRHFGSAQNVIDQLPYLSTQLEAELYHALTHPNKQGAQAALNWLKQSSNHHIVHYNEPHYPELLKQIHCPPLLFFAIGQLDALTAPNLAIVGSRKPTPVGLDMAKTLAFELASSGISITSGLAQGIDGAAHLGCLHAHHPTIAVMGTGIDIIYPSRHQSLAQDIAEHGLLLSEFPLGKAPARHHFPMRNRIISGLSHGVIVVEAALKSGSLITAKYALEQNRDVFAVPGSPFNPSARGCNQLLIQGAKLTQSTTDVLEEYPQLTTGLKLQKQAKSQKSLALPLENLLKFVGFELTSINTILEHTGMDISVLSNLLTQLEIQGHIKALPGGYIKLRHNTHE